MQTGSGQILTAPRIRQAAAADDLRVGKHVVGRHQHRIDDYAVTTVNGPVNLTQHIIALHTEGLVEAMVGVGTQSIHSVIKCDFIHRVDLDIQIYDAVQTVD